MTIDEKSKLDEKIKKAKEIVERMKLEEPYKSITFKTLLEKFLSEDSKHIDKGNDTRKKVKLNKSAIDKLSERLGIPADKLYEIIFLKDDGSFKIMPTIDDGSRIAIQKKGILISSYVLKVGKGERKFSSTKVSKICYDSGINTDNIHLAFQELKNSNLISGVGRASKIIILTGGGEEEAKKIFQGLLE